MRFRMVHSLVGKGRDLPQPLLHRIRCGNLRHGRFWLPVSASERGRGSGHSLRHIAACSLMFARFPAKWCGTVRHARLSATRWPPPRR